MAAPTTPPLPGALTVPVWYGWQAVLALLLLAALGAVAFFVLTAAGSARSQRSEWQAFLTARSNVSHEDDVNPSD